MWDCVHNIDSEDGVRSHSSMSYHSDRQPPHPIGGPYHQIGWRGFYTGWANRYDSLDAPFLAPEDLSFSVYTEHFTKRGSAEFSREGAETVRLPVVEGYRHSDENPLRVHFRVKDQQLINRLLEHRDWTVTIRNRRGREVERVAFAFRVDLAGMRDLYARHVTALKEMESDIASNCRENRWEEVI